VAFINPPRVSPTLIAISSVAKLSNYKINLAQFAHLIRNWTKSQGTTRGHTPAKGTIAKKFMTNTTVGLTFTKCNAMPTGINTNNKLTQLEKIISLSISKEVFLYAREVASECTSCPCGPLFRLRQRFFVINSFPVSRSPEGWVEGSGERFFGGLGGLGMAVELDKIAGTEWILVAFVLVSCRLLSGIV